MWQCFDPLFKNCNVSSMMFFDYTAYLHYIYEYIWCCGLPQEFFLTVKDIIRRSPTSGPDSFAKWAEVEKLLNVE